jgi:hypothetical protein
MKKYLLLFFIFCGCLTSKAQNFTAFEYFFTTDPGYGLATPLSGVPTGNSINFTTSILPPTNIQSGFHYLCIRGRSETGTTTFPALLNRWSVGYYIPMIIFPVSTGTTNNTGINRMEYFFGNDPGNGNGNGINITPDINGNVAIPLTIPSGQLPGFYMMAYRVRTTLGQWSLTKAIPFIIWSNTVNPNNAPITHMEYFVDLDPGDGFGISIPFSPNPNMNIQVGLNLDLVGLSIGDHIIYVRAMNSQGVWSSPKPVQITISCANGVKLFTAQTGNWSDVATWACGRIPTSTDDVSIKSLHSVTLSLGQTANCKTIDNNGILQFSLGSKLNVK